MARKSRWQQFSDNFNSVYGTFNDAFRKIETKKASTKAYENEDGTPMAGLALERARASALADIYTKYGDPEKGLALRASAEGLNSMSRENDVGEATKADQIFQKGAGASGLMRANIDNTRVNTANTGSIMDRRETLLPGEVVGQGLSNTGQSLNNQYASETMPWRVSQERSGALSAESDANVDMATEDARVRSAEAGADNDEAIATTNQVGAGIATATAGTNIEAKLAELRATVAEAENRTRSAKDIKNDTFVSSEILAEGMERGFKTPEELNAWVIEETLRSDMTPAGRLEIAENLNKFGVEALTARAAEIMAGGDEAFQSNGLKGMMDFYVTVQDNVTLVDRWEGDTVFVDAVTPDGRRIPVARGTGENADAQAAEQLQARLKSPSTVMAIAAADLESQQAKANLAETQATTGLRAAQTEETVANTRLLQTRADEILLSMDPSRTGLAGDKARNDAVIQFSDSPEIQYLMTSDDPAERDRALNAIADFERTVGHKEAPPPDIPGAEWYALTPSERKEILTLRAGN